jgi:hypothetical protein
MTSVIYESEIEVFTVPTRLNGEDGALRIYANQQDFEDLEEVCVFENASAAYDFIDQLERALVEAGLHRAEED